ncbi:hypothetical protein J2S43_008169 [Catenuloplanes nepalensis]|uniref:Tat pathway signal sequence domain protein n=1 Tax=Catenuloplanes nepalensis TaxID=587533 RepID=A0ABT9N7H8_9ACTN|nr:DUF3455 domain-containing protein [Catenuloplanes nepalensis]MDP9799657.1 hypothetical protein [Catenuloplanes nepalensis]
MNKTKSRMFKVGGAVAIAGALIGGTLATANAAEQATDTAATGTTEVAAEARGGGPRIPQEIAVPAGNRLIGTMAARGQQVYTCTAGAWVFTEPVATMTGRVNNRPVTAIHFKGPQWESIDDGSLVSATSQASSPVTGSIAQLLLKATPAAGSNGVFGKVTFIHRLATSGGAAPAGACTDGTRLGVAYRAEYRFYAAG